MKKIKLEKTEKKIYKWVYENRYKIGLVFLLYVLSLYVPNLPYINLVVTKDVSYLILIVITVLVFNINSINLIKIGILLFLVAFLFQILDKISTANFIISCIYSFFILAVFKGI
jgi:hypothetical protein